MASPTTEALDAMVSVTVSVSAVGADVGTTAVSCDTIRYWALSGC